MISPRGSATHLARHFVQLPDTWDMLRPTPRKPPWTLLPKGPNLLWTSPPELPAAGLACCNKPSAKGTTINHNNHKANPWINHSNNNTHNNNNHNNHNNHNNQK